MKDPYILQFYWRKLIWQYIYIQLKRNAHPKIEHKNIWKSIERVILGLLFLSQDEEIKGLQKKEKAESRDNDKLNKKKCQKYI